MKKQLDAVELFHKTYGADVLDSPAIPSKERCDLRYKLLKEELDEFVEAYKNNDLVEVADALADLQYILCGSVLEFGLQHKFEAIFDEVQASNMSKLGADGKPLYREDGKVLKGPNYFKPDIKGILEK